jgi:hypothetical protein
MDAFNPASGFRTVFSGLTGIFGPLQYVQCAAHGDKKGGKYRHHEPDKKISENYPKRQGKHGSQKQRFIGKLFHGSRYGKRGIVASMRAARS